MQTNKKIMMSERRTHYIVLCKNCNPSCNCCKSCKSLGFDVVEYKNLRGYHYRANDSITFTSAMFRLKALGVTDFELLGMALRQRACKNEASLVNQGLKRPASEQSFDEEALIKKVRASVLEELKIEASKESFELNRKWEQKFARLEEENHKKFLEFDEDHKKISELEEVYQKVSLQVSDQEKQFSRLLQNQEARDEKVDKKLIKISLSNSEALQKISAQMSKNLQDGIQKGIQVAATELISKQTAQFQEILQSIAPKKEVQTRKYNPNGTTSVPPSVKQSTPRAQNCTQTEQFMNQIFGSYKKAK